MFRARLAPRSSSSKKAGLDEITLSTLRGVVVLDKSNVRQFSFVKTSASDAAYVFNLKLKEEVLRRWERLGVPCTLPIKLRVDAA